MEFSELKAFIQKLYPIQTIDFVLDRSCISSIEFPYQEGQKFDYAKVYYNKILVKIKNMDPFYVSMPTHREDKPLLGALEIINASDIYVSEKNLQDLRDASVYKNLGRPDHNFDGILSYICEYSLRSKDEILKLAGL